MATTTTTLLRLAAGLSWACAFRSATAFHASPYAAAAVSMKGNHRRAALFMTTSSASSSEEATTSSPLTPEALCARAKDFVNYKNAAGSGASTLDDVFDMCSLDVDLYGLVGDNVRPGFTAFFESHKGLHHELLEEPTVLVDNDDVVVVGTVQYPFVKTWRKKDNDGDDDANDSGELQRWSSIDPDKPRNKVERLEFDSEGMLLRVSVVDLSEES
jgi:hypothetical protein